MQEVLLLRQKLMQGKSQQAAVACQSPGVYRPVVARVIEPPCGPLDGLLSPLGLRVNLLLSVEQSPVRGQAFAVAGAFDDDLVAGVKGGGILGHAAE